jgi:hypothetical protein
MKRFQVGAKGDWSDLKKQRLQIFFGYARRLKKIGGGLGKPIYS